MATVIPVHPTAPTPRLVRLADLLDEYLAAVSDRYEAYHAGKVLGPVTGFEKLDAELGGRLAPGLHVVHGGPGAGKTAFCLQMACQCGAPAIFVSCEMGPIELLARLISRATGTFLQKLKGGQLTPREQEALARRTFAAVPTLYLVDATRGALPDAAWLAEAIAVARGDSPHALLVVDSIHSWAAGFMADRERAPVGSEYEVLTVAVDILRMLASEQGIPIIGVAERNRASMDRGGLAASAGSRRFEYSAESVIDLTRAEADDDPVRTVRAGRSVALGGVAADPVVTVQVRLAKNRHGRAGIRVDLDFEGRLQRFVEQ